MVSHEYACGDVEVTISIRVSYTMEELKHHEAEREGCATPCKIHEIQYKDLESIAPSGLR